MPKVLGWTESREWMMIFSKKFSCEHCNKKFGKHEELNRLPEIKCICGFRVFTKERSGLVKSVQAI